MNNTETPTTTKQQTADERAAWAGEDDEIVKYLRFKEAEVLLSRFGIPVDGIERDEPR